MTIERWIILIILGGLLGMIGQGIRLAAGMKKLNDEAAAKDVEFRSLLHPSRIVISLVIGFVAGALGAIGLVGGDVTPEAAWSVKESGTLQPVTIITLIGIGYAGTDFIEAFMSKYTSAFSKSSAQTATKPNGDSGPSGPSEKESDQPPPAMG